MALHSSEEVHLRYSSRGARHHIYQVNFPYYISSATRYVHVGNKLLQDIRDASNKNPAPKCKHHIPDSERNIRYEWNIFPEVLSVIRLQFMKSFYVIEFWPWVQSVCVLLKGLWGYPLRGGVNGYFQGWGFGWRVCFSCWLCFICFDCSLSPSPSFPPSCSSFLTHSSSFSFL